jgi:hypothetical protein
MVDIADRVPMTASSRLSPAEKWTRALAISEFVGYINAVYPMRSASMAGDL